MGFDAAPRQLGTPVGSSCPRSTVATRRAPRGLVRSRASLTARARPQPKGPMVIKEPVRTIGGRVHPRIDAGPRGAWRSLSPAAALVESCTSPGDQTTHSITHQTAALNCQTLLSPLYGPGEIEVSADRGGNHQRADSLDGREMWVISQHGCARAHGARCTRMSLVGRGVPAFLSATTISA